MFCGIDNIPQNTPKFFPHLVISHIYLHANYIDFVGSKCLASQCLYVCKCSVNIYGNNSWIFGKINSSIMNVGERGNYHMQANMSSIQHINLAPHKFCG